MRIDLNCAGRFCLQLVLTQRNYKERAPIPTFGRRRSTETIITAQA